jgi:hypothetical protein
VGAAEGVKNGRGPADTAYGMSVDYSLLDRFTDSRRRHEAARQALPERWRADPRPEVQAINDLWVSVVARARAHEERLAAVGVALPSLDDR